MRRRTILVILLVTAFACLHGESRSASVDFVLLVDTSLSMADAIDDAKRYAAGEVIGRLVEPGDWVSVLEFYGRSEVVWQGDVRGDEDVAAIVRSLNGLVADGRYTDIGSVLDEMDALIMARGQPDRPKYILLITDERQEAPQGTRYYAPDYVIRHPLLEYVKRVDMGAFRVITIGYGLSSRIEGEARSLMTTLSEPPARREPALPGAPAGEPGVTAGGDTAAATGTAAETGTTAGAAGAVSGPGTEPKDAGVKAPETAGGAGKASFAGAPLAASLAAAGAAGIVVAIIAFRRRRRKESDSGNEPEEPSA